MDKERPVPLADIATAFRRLCYNAYTATLVGSPAKVTADFGDRMKDPKVGDFVIETSTVYRSRGTGDIDAIGVLEEVAWEKVVWPGDPEFVWDEVAEGKPHPLERVTYIRTLDGRRFRWINASFIAAPIELKTFASA